MTTFHDLPVKSPNGELIDLQSQKGNAILVVNTATKCGLAYQFEGLEKLHQQYKDKGLTILGFPCDQFMNQEPETNETVDETCRADHGVTFQLTEKVKVNGPETHPVFEFLKEELGGMLGKGIKWNFTKFLISPEGKPLKRYSPTTNPRSIERDIKKVLKN